jgi:hypothetical protein
MAFKLGTNKGLQANNGEIKNKLRFGREATSMHSTGSVLGTPIIRVPLAEDVLGEANMDGTIYISDQVIPGSREESQVINHEMRHATDIKLGKLEYGDYHVKWNGNTYRREEINGMDMINIDGEWKEAGDHDFPWERDANNGNENV